MRLSAIIANDGGVVVLFTEKAERAARAGVAGTVPTATAAPTVALVLKKRRRDTGMQQPPRSKLLQGRVARRYVDVSREWSCCAVCHFQMAYVTFGTPLNGLHS
jgi:hypothetical protein